MRVNQLRNTISIFFACFLLYFQTTILFSQQLDVADGWASVDSLGQNGTTGGEGGDAVTVTTTAEFMSLIITPQPVVIQIADTITLGTMVKVQSNKTIVGIGDQGVIAGGGLNLDRVSNIIIRNLLFTNSMDDAINVQEGTHHIWIDHCDLTDAYDGLIDIKRGSDFVTVSWNKFYNHTKTSLLGHSDNNAAQDVGHLRVTYHHNWFDGTNSRHPRVRFSALTHVYNNYYLDNSYGVGSTMDAEVLVEYNYFECVKEPTLVGVGASGPGDLVERNNIYENCPNPPQTRGEVPEPPYGYEPDSAAAVPALVMANAGRVGFTTSVAFEGKYNLPSAFKLMQNYPNPFNPTTTIQFQLPKASHVTLTIYNAHGQQVATLLDSEMSVGMHNITFNAASFASGLYFYKLQTEGFSNVLKMMLLK